MVNMVALRTMMSRLADGSDAAALIDYLQELEARVSRLESQVRELHSPTAGEAEEDARHDE